MKPEPSKRRKKKALQVEEGAPAWMTTYSDMITLVLAFFVLLFSFAVIEEARFREIISSIRVTFLGAEGILPGSPEPSEIPDGDFEEDEINVVDSYKVLAKIEAFIKEEGLEDRMAVKKDDRGIVLVISDAIMFDPGRADLKGGARDILGYVAELVRVIPNQVLVEGHTDSMPINTPQFPSNWELSAARAVVVVRYLIEKEDLEPAQLAAVGYSEYHPVATNQTYQGRSKNRRVNIIISEVLYEDLLRRPTS